MFIGPWDQGGPWNPSGIEGIHRFLGRVWHLAQPVGRRRRPPAEALPELERALRRATHVTIRDVAEDYEGFHFNTAIAKLMELTNAIVRGTRGRPGRDRCATPMRSTRCCCLLAPAAPHVAEELW